MLQAPRQGSLRKPTLLASIARNKWLYLMVLPGLLYYVVFKIAPFGGLAIVFERDFLPSRGIMGSGWVGLSHFKRLFADPNFGRLLTNTLTLAIYNLAFYFPVPLILALLLNEMRRERFKKVLQSMVYLPHFLSWTVLVSIVYMLLSPSGLINTLLQRMGVISLPIGFLSSKSWFRPLIIIELIWKEAGWGTIIYLAALAGVDPSLYESAVIDGAGRFKQLWHITLPSIRGVVITLLILRMGTFMDSGFEQIYLMLNALNRSVGEVFDTFVYTQAFENAEFSYSTTVGVFKSLVSLVLVLGTNWLAKAFDEEGIY